jgi:uroporphyrin-III C-methyltransferase / precorrin-2 dehydrogenase / sirohydrochlorin ferrochelatase
MQYFPVFLKAQSLKVLVVGAGEVGARKLELILKTPAQVTVVSPWACDTVKELVAKHALTLHERKFEDSDIDGFNLVFVATDDSAVNAHIHALATSKNILVNVVDNTPLCEFITPSIVDRSPVIIAMASGGVAPVLLRYLRQKLESVIPTKTKLLGEFSQKYRDLVKRKLSSVTQRRYFWESVFDGNIAEDILQGNDAKAKADFETALDAYAADQTVTGEVYLVGAGPGDPDLLTFRALRLMQKADVVVFDRLVSPEIVELVRRDAEKIYVGKAKSKHTIPQSEINQLLVDQAKAGNRVVRLKGGDPFIFGRGGEELETLVEHNIPFQVVPAVTAASGAASYAGIPLTHRDHAQSVVFATGHLRDDSIDLNWPALVNTQQTVVFYMGMTSLSIISRELIAHGMSPDMPVAIVASATLPHQHVLTGTLSDINDKVEQSDIKPPALIIVGTVVTLHDSLNWYQGASANQNA